MGIVGALGAGTQQGIADVAGAPVNLATGALNLGIRGVNAITGADIPTIQHPFGGSESIREGLGAAVGATGAPDLANATPQTTGERIAMAAGRGAASMAVPGVAAEAALARTWAEGESFGKAALEMVRGTGPVSNALMGAGSGIGSEVAQEAAPDSLKPVAAMVGGLVGGGLVPTGAMLADAAGAVGRHAWQDAFDPAEVRAARIILAKAADQDSFRQALAEGAPAVAGGEDGAMNLAGSPPTTFQATGDLGIGAFERAVASKPEGVAMFAALRERQNAARLAALQSHADPTAAGQAVSDYVKGQLQAITTEHAANVTAAADGLADSLTQAGGTNFDDAAGYGNALRAPLDTLHGQAKAQTSALWRAIDPDMAAPVATGPLKDATVGLLKDIPSTARAPAGEEGDIFDTIGSLGPVTSFGEMAALRSRLTDAIMAERRSAASSPTVLRRLAITLDNVDETLAGTAGEIAAESPGQAQAVTARLQDEAADWMRQARANARQRAASPGTTLGDGNPAGGDNAGGGAIFRPASGAEIPGGGQPGADAGGQGVPAAGLPEEVAARYAAARQSTATTKETFSRGPVGATLRAGPTFGSFNMGASNVPKNLFDRPEALQAFVRAAGSDPEAMAQMQDYAAFSLRRAAVRDGRLDPGKYENWVATHQYALRQFPDLAAKFSGVANAQAALDDTLAAQKVALANFQEGAARHFLGNLDPVQAVARTIGNATQFGDVVSMMRGNADALAGLKRATVNWMLNKGLSTAEAGTSGLPQIKVDVLQRLIRDNRDSLTSLFGGDGVRSMEAVAGDLQRANRSIVAARLPGASNTAQDLAGMSVLQRLVAHGTAPVAGLVIGNILGHGEMGLAAGGVVSALRSARMDNVNQAIAELMLDPRKAAAAIAKVPAANAGDAMQTFGRRVRALAANELMIESLRSRHSPQQ